MRLGSCQVNLLLVFVGEQMLSRKETWRKRHKFVARTWKRQSRSIWIPTRYMPWVTTLTISGASEQLITIQLSSYVPIFFPSISLNHIYTRESSNTSRQRSCMDGRISVRVMYHRQLYIIDVSNCSDGSVPRLKLQPKRSRHLQTRGIVCSARQVHVYRLMIVTHCLLCILRNIIGSQARIRSMKI